MIALFALSACAPRLVVDRPRGTSAAWLVVDAQSGEVLDSAEPHLRMLPASVMKLVTTFVALRVLGPDYRFVTELGFDRPVEGPKLRANLAISARFDPSFASPRFDDTRETVERIADAIVARGITHWRGDVVVLGDDTPLYAPGTSQDDLGSEYAPPATRFLYAENTRVRSVDRKTEALDDVDVRFSAGDDTDFVCRRPPQALVTHCQVTAPSSRASVTIRYADVAPLTSFERALAQALQTRGVVWSRERVAQEAVVDPLIAITSPPLATLVRMTNKASLNVYADALAFAVNAARGNERSFAAVAEVIGAEARAAGLDASGMLTSDGSGLSRYDALSPAFVVAVLQAGLRAPFADAWMASFAIAGVDGTLRRRAGDGLLFAKSGTMRAQRGLAGVAYRRRDRAHPLVLFALFVDHHPGNTNALLDQVITALTGRETKTSPASPPPDLAH